MKRVLEKPELISLELMLLMPSVCWCILVLQSQKAEWEARERHYNLILSVLPSSTSKITTLHTQVSLH